jgi:hypothetical protein
MPQSSRSSLPLFWIGLALLLAALFAGCAAESPPVPPRVERPEAIKNLSVEQIGQAFKISFTLPALATDGESLTKPLEVEIFRSVSAAGQTPSAAAGSTRPWISLPAREVRQHSQGSEFTFQDALSDREFRSLLNSTSDFSVVTLTRGFRRRPILSAPSNKVSTTLLDVSGPLAPPSIETTEKALVLRWMPPSRTLSGAPVSSLHGYRIYVSPTGAAGTFHLLGESRSSEFSDGDFQFGRPYYFMVRAAFSADGARAESASSETVDVIPKDTFPPAVPEGLSAIQTEAGVELVWHPGSEPDLAGYRVYRRRDSRTFVLLNSELVRTPVYRDASVAHGQTFFYAVSAVDLSGNESAKSAEITIRMR